MPVKRRPVGQANPEPHPELTDELVRELGDPKPFGQPMVDEETFPRTGLLGVTVVWDKWGRLSDPQRTETILEAYSRSAGLEVKNRIAFAVGLTFPEAAEAGKLPYMIIPNLIRPSPAEPEACLRAMIELGATTVVERGKDYPLVLYFPTRGDAEEGYKKLVELLPGSEPVWRIIQTVESPDRAIG